MKKNIQIISLIFAVLFSLNGCKSQKETFTSSVKKSTNPYNPVAKMEQLAKTKEKDINKMHFLVFGDSKGRKYFKTVLKRADSLQPDFCITTADLVGTGGGKRGTIDYKKLDKDGGWFMRKYPMWPTVGNHEERGGDDALDNFSNFFGIKTEVSRKHHVFFAIHSSNTMV